MMVSSAETPIAPTYWAKCCGDGSVCGKAASGSEPASWSRKRAPGMRAASYSARASRFCAGRYQEASMIVRPGWPRRSCSQSASTVKGLSSAILFSCRLLMVSVCSVRRHRAEADAEAPVLPALLFDLADVDFADFAGAPLMGAAAGLAVHRGIVTDADQTDLAGANRRSDVLGLHQARIRGQFLVADQSG